MKCPLCGSLNFFVKDPEDAYEIYEFELKEDSVVFNRDVAEPDKPVVDSGTEVFCEKCSWHDKFQELKNR
jgi:hypothetical protein